MEHKSKTKVCKELGIPTYETAVIYHDYFDSMAVYYHDTAIATIWGNGKVKIDNGGWHTQTTKRRINAILDALGLPYSIVQRDYIWYLCDHRNGTETQLVFGKPNWNGATPGIYFDTNTKELLPQGE